MRKRSMRIKPDAFRGEGDNVQQWIYRFRQAIQMSCWDDELALVSFPAFMQGYALVWYEQMGKYISNIHTLLTALQKEFQAPHEGQLALTQLRHRTQKPGEPVE